LSIISNYLALGCLKNQEDDTLTSESSNGLAQWQDLPLTASGFPPEPNLMKLTAAGWTRVQIGQSTRGSRYTIYRVYILPGDVGLRFLDRENRRLLAALESLVATIDVSPETWSGRYSEGVEVGFDAWATRDEGSLFYMFNKLPSPRPDPTLVKERYTREAVEDLLDTSPASALVGLKTPLYPYQRRSAALMLQRESVSTLMLDPRLEPRTAPDGSTFYFGPRELLFHRNPRYYEASRGGILAESMGLGKTLICLSLILATRHHLPMVPAAYGLPLVRAETASLADMAVSAINRKSVPWRVEFERIKHASQEEMSSCAQRLENTPPVYEIPVEPARWNRKTVIPLPQKKTLASTTIIVVPRNLCKQWHSEIQKHVDESVLRILLMEEPKSVLPAADEIRGYDLILFSRSRFELEVKDGADDRGRRLLSRPPSCTCPYIGATRTVDCHCINADDIYESPLKQLHFKRLIIDEGHFFSSSNNTAVLVAKKLLTADHRWVVSGTPAKDLLGVEADMSVAQNAVQEEAGESREEVLDRRRRFNPKEDTSGAIKSLGTLASHFLRIRPWAAEGAGERPAVWEEHIYRHEEHRRRTFSGFSSCLRRTLEAMVVKTQPEDVEQDINLPPLSHEVIRLEPSFYDKLTSNLFSIVLTANAVTSERKDGDYLFHKNSAQARYQLIGNLRQSAFFWTGFSEEDIIASQKNSRGYLEKPSAACTYDDRRLLTEALQATDAIIASPGWKALSRSHELGVFIDGWPQETADFWAFGGSSNPMLTGISQLLEAQKHVNERVGLEDPGEGLAGVGIRSMKRAEEGRREDQVARKESKPNLSKAGISLSGEPTLKRRASSSSKSEKYTPKRAKTSKNGRKGSAVAAVAGSSGDDPGGKSETAKPATTAKTTGQPSKRRWSDVERSDLFSDSPFSRGLIIGTTSAKLSYLTSQILKYHQEEKILVFYEGDNIAYYIAQMLELLHIKHEIYAKSLAAALKSEYVVRFNEEPQDRVLLMDVKHAAHGLNISSASRIYFVNPVCRPDIEAQAIKRAHRIGQTRQVFVQTLLLKGTIEEKMHERAKRMTSVEHHVSHLEDDDGMREIIQGAGLMSVRDGESSGLGQMASLEVPQRLWARPGWRDTLSKSNFSSAKLPPAEAAATLNAGQTVSSKKRKGKEKEKAKWKKSVQLATPLPLPHRAVSPVVSVPSQGHSMQQLTTLPETSQPAAASSFATKRQQDEDEDNEPMMDRWRLLPQASRRF
jgi:SNF2 family DNA or RNA helicase